MQYHSQKFKRGQVWMVRQTATVPRTGFRSYSHEQQGTRPMLIISSDFGNKNSPVMNCLCITSQDKRSSVNVPLVDEDGKPMCILCNQQKTVDKSDFLQYMFTVDDQAMTEVENTLLTVLGFKLPDLHSEVSKINDILENIVKIKQSNLSSKHEFEIAIEQIVRSLDDSYSKAMQTYIEQIKVSEDRIKSCRSFTKSEPKSNKQTPAIKTNKSSSKPRGYWSEDRVTQLLEDFENAKSNDDDFTSLVIKYQFKDVKELKKYVSNFKWKLKKSK